MKTPQGEFLGDRRRALEDAFFAERDRMLLERLRKEMQDLEERKQLAQVGGVLDQKTIDDLLHTGIRAETLAAIRLIPLVEVAWCDGQVSPAERKAVLQAATENGIQPGTACYDLLDSWLESRPDPKVLASWKEYVAGLASTMPADSMQKMRYELERYLRAVASAAGGILGLARVSKAEQDTIAELIQATRV